MASELAEPVAAALRRLPKIDALLARPDVLALGAPRWVLVRAVRLEVEAMRQRILAGEWAAGDPGDDFVLHIPVQAIADRVAALLTPSLRPVINATGVVLHTNLGRTPLAPAAVERVAAIARGYSNLEYDLDAGGRGSRHGHLVPLLTELTGAEDAVCVNNNAAAVMLCLAALAAGREVIVSRGELVEIGGSFRIPDVMALSGARLVEVGTTNKTRIADYRAALSERTALLMKVHPSNFAMVGFTEEASVAEVAALAREAGVPAVMDLGSGSLAAVGGGLSGEPEVARVVEAGVDLVTFSGDKLLGGPQAGIVCGRRDLVAAVRRHPLMRALRPDKLALAGLEATLEMYRDVEARRDIPVLAMLEATDARVRERAERVLAMLGDVGQGAPVAVELCACESTPGGGSAPLARIPSWALVVTVRDMSAAAVERRLRAASVPVIGRIEDDRVLLDLRTVADSELSALVAALRGLAS